MKRSDSQGSDKTVAEQMQECLDKWMSFEPVDLNVLVRDMRRWIKEIEEEKTHSFNKGMEWVRDEGWDYTRHNS